MKPARFSEIEGLRGYLALWVAVGHGLQLAGYLKLPAPLDVLLGGDSAVDMFIIISGFVITHLIRTNAETYGAYITRRFFRLYPAYAICCLAGFLLMPAWADIVRSVPWQDLPGWAEYSRSVGAIAWQSRMNTLPHLLLHAVMLHGLVPMQVLNHAAMTFLPAAWSVSLEWQFYLVAPFVLAGLRSPAQRIWLVAAAAVLFAAWALGLLGQYPVPATLPARSVYFAIGIGSRLAFERLHAIRTSPLFWAAVALLLMLGFVRDAALGIWTVFFIYLLWHEEAGFSKRVFQALVSSRVPMFLGQISYSIYLVHRPVQVALGDLAVSWFTVSRPMMLAVQWGAILVAIPISYLLYRWVEKPGIALGKYMARARRPALATP